MKRFLFAALTGAGILSVSSAEAVDLPKLGGEPQGVHAQAYLTWAFERLGTHRDLFALPLEQITPAAFKKTLS